MKYKLITLLLFTFLLKNILYGKPWQWAQQISSTASLGKTCMDIDSYGNIYVTGVFTNSINIGSTQLFTSIQAIYLAKYNAIGSLLYAKKISEDSALIVSDISIDQNNGIVITGQFKGTSVFGINNIISLTSTGDYDVFIARFDDNDVIWANEFGMSGYDYGSALSYDASGNSYVVGEFHISPFQFSSSKIFVYKFDSLGNSVWTKIALSYSSTDLAEDIVTDANGMSIITGQFFGTLTFDSLTILDAGNIEANVFLTRLDSNGNIEWMQKAGAGSGYCGGIALGLKENGFYLSGFFHGSIILGNLSLSGNFGTANQAFFSKLDLDGNFLNVTKTDGRSQGRKIISNTNGFIAIGYFNDSLHAGPDTLINSAAASIYIINADSNCNILSGQQVGGTHNIMLGDFKLYNNNYIISGEFQDTLELNPSTLLSNSGNIYDAFLASSLISTGITNSILNELKISFGPNPITNNSTLFIENSKSNIISVEIYDENGKEINKLIDCSHLTGSYQIKINNDLIPCGKYLLKVNSGLYSQTFRLIRIN
jgi:hypothetical protein